MRSKLRMRSKDGKYEYDDLKVMLSVGEIMGSYSCIAQICFEKACASFGIQKACGPVPLTTHVLTCTWNEKIELTLSQSTMDESQISPNDVVGKVLGKEHSGRVRCLGLGVVPKVMIPEQFAGFFVSPSTNSPTTTPSDAASEPILPMNTMQYFCDFMICH
ncbi:hypothetical protein KY290_027936 [Solanum tuberosum]|uniref:Uncharacterized protein n=1 Tax=Solanum tuberosum TaxID=4113 RepID=A0ABQ7UI62_SOLTU|nr:hypothetical protein KY290_027936 [Solanum tuberosum]